MDRTGSPTAWHLYILVGGVLLGALASTPILGRWSPATYEKLLIGGRAERLELDQQGHRIKAEEAAHHRDLAEQRQRIQASGATMPDAFTEVENRLNAEWQLRLKLLELRQEELDGQWRTALARHDLWIRGRMTALLLALAALMVLEAFTAEGWWQRVRGGLTTARYGLVALWAALLIARPQTLALVPLELVGALVAVCALAALLRATARQG